MSQLDSRNKYTKSILDERNRYTVDNRCIIYLDDDNYKQLHKITYPLCIANNGVILAHVHDIPVMFVRKDMNV